MEFDDALIALENLLQKLKEYRSNHALEQEHYADYCRQIGDPEPTASALPKVFFLARDTDGYKQLVKPTFQLGLASYFEGDHGVSLCDKPHKQFVSGEAVTIELADF